MAQGEVVESGLWHDIKMIANDILTIFDNHKLGSEIILFGLLVAGAYIFRKPLTEFAFRIINRFFPAEEGKKLQEINHIIPEIEKQLDKAISQIESLKNTLVTKQDIQEHYRSLQDKLEEVKRTVTTHYENLNSKIELQNQQLINKLQEILNQIENSLLTIKSEISNIKVMSEQIKGNQASSKEKLDDLSKKFKDIHEGLHKIEDICSDRNGGSRF